MLQALTCLTTQHDGRLVALAVVVCLLASAVAISLFHRVQSAEGPAQWSWLGFAAVATGYGVWATHFIAILAYQESLDARYQPALTILSLLLLILITGAGLTIARSQLGGWSAAIGGGVVGLGVAVMHFTGMAALDLPGQVTWSPSFILAAILLGIVFGSLAFGLAARRIHVWASLTAAFLFTLAVLLTHFTGMAAMRFVPDPARVINSASLSPEALSAFIAGLAAIILSMCLVAALSDRMSKDKLRHQKVLLDCAIENLLQGLCMYDADGRITLFNKRYAMITGLSEAALTGLSLVDLLKQRRARGDFNEDPEAYLAKLIAKMRKGKPNTTMLQVAGGRTFRVVDNPMPEGGWVTTLEDITDWQKAQAQISRLAQYDVLTDLPNRTFLREQLEKALSQMTPDGKVVVYCVNLDHFKDINDSLGLPIGDELLREVACRLSACTPKGSTVARLGSDEFAIVQPNLESQPAAAAALAKRMTEELAAPFNILGREVVIGTSIGISLAPIDGSNPDQLLTNAHLALAVVKASGRGTHRFFATWMDAKAQTRRLLLDDLRAALSRGEFVVYYQPIYKLETDRIVGFEALVRWSHPTRGLVSPTNFIPLAEETGLIVAIGEWVLRQACVDATSWPSDVSVAVNLSPVQFKNCDPVASVVAALSESGLAPQRLELEITESVLLLDSDTTMAALHKLRALGIRISMDDFGTGYSSLSYLRSFPFDKIKIDQSFVRDLSSSTDSMAIVRAISGLGKSLGITTLAEGVETKEQLALLRRKGCDEVQGYLFSRPVPQEEVEKMLAIEVMHVA